MNLIPRELRLLLAVKRFQREVTMNGKKTLIPSLVTLLLTGIGLFQEPVQAYIATHPALALAIAGVYAVIKGLLPSPVAGAPK